ncbi:MAG: glycosyltransferase family 2 protein [Acidobacteria bacterium]|nr:glycosyltransferase family 2 protein [Acidobacteriota bacterium]
MGRQDLVTPAAGEVLYGPAPSVSVVICTFNRAGLVGRAIESVLAQTWRDWELVIVDDGGSDSTFDVVNRYVMEHAGIRYLKHRNREQALARNLGIKASFGEYVAFLDSDDAYSPEHLESRLEYLRAHPEVDMIQGGLIADPDIDVVDYFDRSRTINLHECVVCGTFVAKRSVLVEVGGFPDEPPMEDTALWYRVKARFRTAEVMEPRTYIYTRAESSVTRDALERLRALVD